MRVWRAVSFVLLAVALLGAFGPAAVRADWEIPPTRIGEPVRLKIPKLHVDAAIEYVGLTDYGAMDTPKNFGNVAWYTLGPRPGELGNAVISGHVDSATGRAVFWSLRDLVAGDEIIVVGDDGMERRFLVKGWETYKDSDAPLERIYGASLSTSLNLITCDQNSSFDRGIASYTGSLVVYADLAT